MVTTNEWVGAWDLFLDDVEAVILKKLGYIEGRSHPKAGPLRDLLAEVMNDLRDDGLRAELGAAIDKQMVDRDGARILDLLFREMLVFHAVAVHARDSDQEADADEATDDADTVKSSIDDLVKKLPKRLQKLLKILNQILKLASGGGG